MKRVLKNKRGISLIVLVITIIIMIILATAVILSLSSSSVVDKANKAVSDTALAQAEERATMCIAEWELMNDAQRLEKIKELNGGVDPNPNDVTLKNYIEKTLVSDGILKLSELSNYEIADNGIVTLKAPIFTMVASADSTPVQVPVPKGFTASIYNGENTVADGFVIYEATATQLGSATQEEAQTTYNQFVWVPVNSISQFVRKSWNVNGTVENVANYLEPSNVGYPNESTEYNNMVSSVENYNGFYIARYEAGKEGTNTLVNKKGKNVWNWIIWGYSKSVVGTDGAVYFSQQMYKNSDSVVSTLCYGVQWDATLNFISKKYSTYAIDSSEKGYYAYDRNGSRINEETLQTSGYYSLNNIYDMAGNVAEWTMESSNNGERVMRGGPLGGSPINGPAADRSYFPDESGMTNDGYVGFRVCLYLK